MLGKKKEVQNSSNSSSIPNSNALNSIVAGTKLEGTLTANNDIRIDGELIGTLICSGKLIVGVDGKINGEVQCENAVIEGAIIGKLKVKELLNVRETGKIEGEVDPGKLNIQAGAVFNVSCSMGGSTIKHSGAKMAAVN
ncbi:MAG TPA: polymer-forming cytoskeletal protein [Saprospiraceae bacterium]|nr:polymer-forming cytoskeletal protein [Lewinellaceae bacterium]HPK09906.1 polymer-forming cytoskeletal protein [Saprospiraceae bacterium]HRX29897.1 polymer-forming cytoskeletal protein [Saprospiraceae bacterium]